MERDGRRRGMGDGGRGRGWIGRIIPVKFGKSPCCDKQIVD